MTDAFRFMPVVSEFKPDPDGGFVTFAFEVSLALGADLSASPATWVWTDVTRYVGLPSITITRGRSDRYAAADADQCSLTFLNNSGRFVPRNPLSPYYGLLNRGTPLRVRIRPTTAGAFRTQFTGFVNEWPVRWADSALTQSYAPITASGVLRRLSRAQPLKSAIYRVLEGSTAIDYWPMEDGTDATAFVNVTGRSTGTFSGISLGADSAIAGSNSLPTLSSTGRIAFPVSAYTSAGVWAVAWVMRIPASSLSGSAQAMSWTTPSGSIVRWQIRITPGTPDTVIIDGFTSSGGVVSSSSANLLDASSGAELTNGRQLYFQANGAQSGGNIDVNLTIAYVPDSGSPVTSVGIAWSTAATNGAVSRIYHDSVTGFAGGGHTIGHVALGTDVGFGAGTIGAAGGAGDTTGDRFASLLATQDITPLVGDLVRGATSTTQQMGPQRTGDVLTQLREVEATELGVMHDSKQGYLELLPRSYRYNRPVDLTLNVATGQVGWPFEPVDDDIYLRNDVTVSNVAGSSARATASAATIRAQGVYADTVQENVYRGIDLQQHANWRLNLGSTGSGLRYPSITVNLTSNADTIGTAWCNTDIGSRIQVTGVPSRELPPETLDLIVDGYTETISATAWTAVLNCSPGSQWLTTRLDLSSTRLDCGASTTSGSLTTTATSVPVAIADPCVWTLISGAFGIYIGGELMTVTAVSAAVGSGSSWTQTLTVTRSVNGIVKTHVAGEEVHVSNPIILAL